MAVGRFAKLAFLIPATLLVLGLYSISLTLGCGPHVATAPCMSNATNDCPPEPAYGTACVQPLIGLTLFFAGGITIPLAYLFYRSRFYTPLPP